jgi:hypothetical protein
LKGDDYSILNLFNSKVAASEQLEQIEDWLADRTDADEAKDLLVYYTGHGGFSRNDQSYFLAVHRTREGSEGATSIRYVDLASAIKRHAEHLRKYLILDCCFAASAVIKTQSALAQAVIQRVEDELPPSGTAVLCSSAAKLVSIAPAGERNTMFSGAVLHCLTTGVPNGPSVLSLEDIGKAARELILEKYPDDAVRPELHVPEQALGNPARVPLFPNPLWNVSTDDDRVKFWATAGPTIDESFQAWSARLGIPVGRIAIGVGSGIASAVGMLALPKPLGINFDSAIPAPIAPALVLSVAMLLVLALASRMSRKFLLIVPVAVYVAWSAAYFLAFTGYRWEFSAANPWRGTVASICAGFLGALLLNLFLWSSAHGWRVMSLRVLRDHAINAIVFGAVGALGAVPTLAAVPITADFPHFLSVFLPWQILFLATQSFGEGPSSDRLSPHEYLIGLVASGCLVLGLSAPAVRFPIAGLIEARLPISVGVAIGDVSDTIEPTYNVQSGMNAAMQCRLHMRESENGPTQSSEPVTVPPYENFRNDYSAKFKLSNPDAESVWFQLSCQYNELQISTAWDEHSLKLDESEVQDDDETKEAPDSNPSKDAPPGR